QTKLVKLGDTSVVKLIGNVFFFHNGAIISCDSAYRYSERRIEAMGNVIINQDSLYIYGDKVVYNGETEIAEVYSELIKAVDSTATIYTRQMYFNTREKTGYFSGGATMRDGNNLLEAERGTYNTNTRIVTLNDRVAMENEEYVLKTSALIYDQNKETAFFNVLTNIWNVKGEYLEAKKGNYDRIRTIYNFEKDSYILTKEQECWSDSLIYFSKDNEVELKRNIQIDDTTQRASSFGDYGYFWNKSKNVLLTKRPSMFSYSENKVDTAFVRADTITVRPFIERSNIYEKSDDIMGPMGVLDSLMGTDSLKLARRDSLQIDKLSRDSS
ncbi:MAG: OstA-like protein, partial [Rikenellaceae bacterium]